MKLIKYLFIGLLSILTLIIAGAYIALQLVDLEQIKQLIAKQVQDQTGRHLEVAGDIKPTIGYNPTLTLQDISLSNPEWSESKTLLQAKEIHVALQLMPLLKRKVVIDTVRITGAIVDLEKDAKGNASWSFDSSEPKPEDAAGAQAAVNDLVISEIYVTDTLINYYTGGKKQSVAVKNATIKGVKGQNVDEFSLDASYEEASLNFQGSINNGNAMLEGSIAGDGVTIGTKGSFAISDTTFDMMVTAKAESVAALAKLAKQSSDNKTPLNLSASVGGKPDVFNLKDMKLTYGDIEADGKADINLTAAKPYINATLHIPTLTQEASAAPAEPSADAATPAAPSGLDAPLPLDALDAVNANIKLVIDTLKTPSVTLSQVNATAEVKDKKLSLEPLSAQLSGGAVSGSIVIDNSEAVPTLMFTMLSQQLGLESVMKDLAGINDIKNGTINTKVVLNGTGRSIKALLGSSNGEINFFVDGAQYNVPQTATQALQFLNVLGKGETLDVSCMVGQFDVKSGVATSKSLGLKTPAAIALGSGSFNLAAQSLNMLLKLDNSSVAVSDIVPPIRISGPFSNPSVMPDPKATLASLSKAVLGTPVVTADGAAKPADGASGAFAVAPSDNPCLMSIAQAQQNQDKKSLKGVYKSVEKSIAAKRDALKQGVKNIGTEIKQMDNPLKNIGTGFEGFLKGKPAGN